MDPRVIFGDPGCGVGPMVRSVPCGPWSLTRVRRSYFSLMTSNAYGTHVARSHAATSPRACCRAPATI